MIVNVNSATTAYTDMMVLGVLIIRAVIVTQSLSRAVTHHHVHSNFFLLLALERNVSKPNTDQRVL